ncbi:MAG: autotransporter outer membrane beta-barrel domain-containing protein [Phascolarctobacterium sp.]|nr:autotransporter outer membrane beta-barrel domain-containing protein [Phascolarctobacterium sp.]MBR2039412.1 autotransporter outer membrane beta-barrel domain-containing protein [Phascolarctobacterium sp.]
MSKKILKRSLALGALMAFVITGSAMAGEKLNDITNSTTKDTIVNGGSWELEKDTVTLLNDSKLDDSNNIIKNATISLKEGQTLNVYTYDEVFNGPSMIVNSTIDGKVGTVNIHQFGTNNALGYYTGGVNVTTIDVGEINIIADGGYAVYTADHAPDNYTLTAKKINISANFAEGSSGTAGLYAAAGGITVNGFDELDIVVTNTSGIEGEGGAGIMANAGTDIEIIGNEGSKVDVSSEGRGAIVALSGGNLDIEVDSLEASSTNLAGESNALSCTRKNSVVVAQDNSNLNIKATGNVIVTAEENMNALGAYQNGNLIVNGNNVTVNGQIHAQGNEGPNVKAHIGIVANNDVTINGNLMAHWAQGDSVNSTEGINIKGKNITVNSEDADNVLYNGAASVKFEASQELIMNCKNGLVNEGGTINVAADNINITAEDFAVISYTGTTDIAPTSSSNIVGDILVYDLYDNATPVVNVDLGEGGSLTGTVVNKHSGAGTGVNLDLGEGSTFNATGNSNFNSVSGNGTIGVANLETTVDIEDASKLEEVTVTTNSDNLGTDVNAGMEKLNTLVTSGDNTVADKLVATAGAMYDEVTADVVDGKVQNVEKEVAAANISVNDMAAIGLMSWRAEMNDMNKRMGELRNANGEHGVWVRMVRGESEYNSVKNQYNQYQLGYDEKLSVDKRWTVGVALSYTDAENNFAQGNGESTNKALSIYGSKLNEDGTFIDLIAKYARLENDFTTYSGQGAGEYDANGYSFSAEFGKRIQQGNGLWIEPQVELTYGKVGSADYVTENNVKVAQDSMDSIVGRVGFSLGKDIKDGNVYARASYLYDFDGETKAVLNSVESLEQDLGGGWWEVGVGANINLSKATYIYADIEKTFGGEVDTNWQWNLGVRYSF